MEMYYILDYEIEFVDSFAFTQWSFDGWCRRSDIFAAVFLKDYKKLMVNKAYIQVGTSIQNISTLLVE